MSNDWRELLDRVLDGEDLAPHEAAVLREALSDAQLRDRAAEQVRSRGDLFAELSAPAVDDVPLSRDRLLAKVILREKSLAVRQSQRHTGWRAAGRWIIRFPAAAAAVAAVFVAALGLGLVALWNQYPQPLAEGDLLVVPAGPDEKSGEGLQRGALVIAGQGGAELRLGGYCHLVLQPDTELVLAGQPRAEEVEVRAGSVTARIVPERGAFTCRTPLGPLRVLGTEFVTTVEYPHLFQGEEPMKRLTVVTVAVLSGVVGFDLAGQSGTLTAGASRTFAGEEKQVDKLPEAMLGFHGMFAGTLVSKEEDQGTFVLRVTKILHIWKENKAKDAQSAVGKSLKIELDPKSRHFEQFNKVLKTLQAGDMVEVEAFPNEAGRLIVVEALQKQIKRPAEKPARPAAEKPAAAGDTKLSDPPEEKDLPKEEKVVARGRVIGTVVGKGAGWIEVKSQSGKTARYRPRWVGGNPSEDGGFDKGTLAVMSRLREGDRVLVLWYADDHVRIHEIEPVR
jgi:hypothetical protein